MKSIEIDSTPLRSTLNWLPLILLFIWIFANSGSFVFADTVFINLHKSEIQSQSRTHELSLSWIADNLIDPKLSELAREKLRAQARRHFTSLQAYLNDHGETASFFALNEDNESNLESPPNQYVPARKYYLSFLRQLPREMAAIYQEEFDLHASGLLARAIKSRSIPLLTRLLHLYPIASSQLQARGYLADLLIEQGNLAHAKRVLEEFSVQEQARLFSEKKISNFNQTRQEFFETLSKLNSTTRPPSWSAADLKRAHWRVHWTRPFIEGEHRLKRSEHFSSLMPVNWSGKALVSSPTGWESIDPAKGALSQKGRIASAKYNEIDPQFRLQPVCKDSYAVIRYVEKVSKAEGMRGFRRVMIREAIPQRSFMVMKQGTSGAKKLWDLKTLRHKHAALADFSFNGNILIHKGKLYSVGWKRSGYLELSLWCFRLADGNIEYSVPIAGGQGELTRFGYLANEPWVGQIKIEEDRLYVGSNLGVLACLDWLNGKHVWLSRYSPRFPSKTIMQRRRMSYPYFTKRQWDSSEIFVNENYLVVAPLDSPHLLLVDKYSGSVLSTCAVPRGSKLLGLSEDFVLLSDTSALKLFQISRNRSGHAEIRQFQSLRVKPRIDGNALLFGSGLVYTHQNQIRLLELSKLKSSDPSIAEGEFIVRNHLLHQLSADHARLRSRGGLASLSWYYDPANFGLTESSNEKQLPFLMIRGKQGLVCLQALLR